MLGLIFYWNVLSQNPWNNYPILNQEQVQGQAYVALSEKSFSMSNRYENEFVNNVFKDNILLTLRYMNGDVAKKDEIVWDEVTKPFEFSFSLNPGEKFAFHDQIDPKYAGGMVKTTNAHFNFADGFKSDGYLMGDGVCHLASLIYWAAKDAGLDAVSPVNHNFAKINEVPKEFGVSIYFAPGNFYKGARENLYITNNFDTPITFLFRFDGEILTVKLTKPFAINS